ncbi:MAG: hypothetical protein NVSMB47_06290 [Polyangiales bacterium]
MTTAVRDARLADRPALAALIGAVAEFDAEEQAVALELVDDALAARDDYRVLVAVANERVAGYACFGPTPMTRGTFDLYWIATSVAARGAGVGGALVEGVVARMRAEGGRLLRVETSSRSDYAATRRFYDRSGFAVAATIRDFYAPDDALVVYARYL